MNSEEIISKEDFVELIKLARNAIELKLAKIASFSQLVASEIHFPQKRGAFVGIIKNNEVHGCMGTPWPDKCLSETVKECALKSAFEDPRTLPLVEADLSKIKIELSVLTIPQPITPNQIKIGLHGLIVHNEMGSGLLLPHIAVKYGWNVEAFLAGTCVKAGLPLEAWKDSEIYAFEVQVDRENQ